jgi:hypothetical protein
MRKLARCVVQMLIVATLFRLDSSAAAQQASEPAGARALFYNPWTGTVLAGSNPTPVAISSETSKPGTQSQPTPPVRRVSSRPKADGEARSVGVHYWLELDGVGAVADSRVFTTGERLRLHVRSNSDGYLAVWTVGDGRQLQLLLPIGGDPAGTAIKSGQEYVSPRVRFQPPAAEEKIFVAFARQKQDLPSFEVAGREPQGARDLIIETDEQTAGEVGTYVINRRGGPIAKEIRLRHSAP